MPGRHVPKQNRARLERRDLAEQKEHAAPLRPFPGHMRLDEKSVRDQRAKTAQRRDEPELPQLFAQIEIEIHRAEMQLPIRFRKRVFHRQARGAEKQNTQDRGHRSHHNSFRKKTAHAMAR